MIRLLVSTFVFCAKVFRLPLTNSSEASAIMLALPAAVAGIGLRLRAGGRVCRFRLQQDKGQADALFAELGMNLSTAFNIFVRQSLREGGIPFEVKLEQPNKETIAAMLEAERIAKDPSVKGYNDLDELFADLKK